MTELKGKVTQTQKQDVQNLPFIKSLLSRGEDIADILNTYKQTQRRRQNEEAEKLTQIERIRQGQSPFKAKQMKETCLREFKAMIMRTHWN